MTTQRDLSLRLTRKGLVAAICAAAEPFEVPACKVTVYEPAIIKSSRGEKQYKERACGEHVSRYGLCVKHAADRDRLMGESA